MRRVGLRAPLWAAHDEWFALKDGFGQWRLVNHHGAEPLRDPDPTRRVRAAYLAAAAPRLLALLEATASRLTRLAEDHQLDRRTRTLAREGLIAVADARPPLDELLSTDNPQLELVLEAGEVQLQVQQPRGRRRA
jgi:hypothetical protein